MKMPSLYLIIAMTLWRALAMLIFAIQTVSIFLHKEVDAQQQFCIQDDIPRHTLIRIDLKTKGQFLFEFKEGLMPIMNVQLNGAGITRSVTSQRYGLHNFCFTNRGSRSSIAFQISIGNRANDYGSPVGGDDLVKGLQNQARIAQQFIGEIVNENTEGLEIIMTQAKQAHFFGQYMIFTLVFAGASIFMTYMQYKVIKKHLHSRKYI